MSLKIIIDEKEAALPADTEVCLKLHNYFFEDRDNDATYPITLNLNANRHIFGYPERISEKIQPTEYAAAIFFGPYCLLRGKCIITDFTQDEIEVFLSESQSSFWEKCNVRLTNLDLGGENFTGLPAMMTAFTESLHGGKDYIVCPLYDPYVNNIYLNLWMPFYNYLTPATDTNSAFKTQASENSKCLFAPFIRLNSLIEKIATALGYTVERNDLIRDSQFKDIIVVCRNNAMDPLNLRPGFNYADRVPDIKTSDLILEIENKFGCRFFVEESSKTISILSLDYSDAYHEVTVTDSWQKHILDKEDQHQGFVFTDKEIPDKYLEKYYENDDLNRITGDEENAEKIECISAPVGWSSTNITLGYIHHMAVAADYENDQAYLKNIREELRFAIYRGYIKYNPDSAITGNTYYPYPIATPEPISSGKNNMSLLYWGDGNLYDKYLRNWVEIMLQICSEMEFQLENKLIYLSNPQQLFSKILLINNKKFRCYEQEIKLNQDYITEYLIRCYPA